MLLQRYFHDTFQIPLNRIHIHPDNISDPIEKASTKRHYGDIILGIPASPFAEFIDAFIGNQVKEISAGRMAPGLTTLEGRTSPLVVPFEEAHLGVEIYLLIPWHPSRVCPATSRLFKPSAL